MAKVRLNRFSGEELQMLIALGRDAFRKLGGAINQITDAWETLDEIGMLIDDPEFLGGRLPNEDQVTKILGDVHSKLEGFIKEASKQYLWLHK